MLDIQDPSQAMRFDTFQRMPYMFDNQQPGHAELGMLNGENNSIRGPEQNEDASGIRDGYSMQHYGGSLYDNLSFDALFGSHYDSDKDEDYSLKEDLI